MKRNIEVFKEIKNYKKYEISNHGNIRKVLKSGKYRQLKTTDNGNGYLRINLTTNKITTKQYIHRLVADAFITNSLQLPQVHHRDHVKTNNHDCNLEWVTSKENNRYRSTFYRNRNK